MFKLSQSYLTMLVLSVQDAGKPLRRYLKVTGGQMKTLTVIPEPQIAGFGIVTQIVSGIPGN